ncbi:phosphate ABC transporter permease subunit PstC [Breznakiella homolactica]|uniref:Phosphate transport system permease protein n=1 Tax=Breznakiella homolactica TaxID=2798577 RepID=A0A7T7XKI4_9SPIR|nr:phosphate ABC transporter permease subunit PstC [Breznakiella homolactica]QQO07882.1 phosphate ABC transporter permease subunit PstC [Breznakiella homolactica]
MNRYKTDILFKYLVRGASGIAVVALGAILFFVFFQGAEPFVSATAPGIRLVTEQIDAIEVNGTLYENPSTFIDIPRETRELAIRFSGGGKSRSLDITVDSGETDPDKQLVFETFGSGEISSPESYVYTLTYPGRMAGLEQKIHILLPEPPYSVFRFLGGLDWRPTYNKVYGILPMILGTILTSLGAILLGVPIALLCALFLAEFVPEKPAALIRGGIELLAGIPSVVYGFFGLMVVVPAVKQIFNVPSGNGLLSAVLILGIMILPTVTSIAETSFRAVSGTSREASLALGASKMQTAWHVVLPHARSGVITGIILGISRAVGETMAVILVAGNSAQLIRSPLDSVRTLTATIALEMGYAQGRHSLMLFSVGVVLFIMILLLNSAILYMRRRLEKEAS